MCLINCAACVRPFLAELHIGRADALLFFTIENKFANLCCWLVVVNSIWIGQRKRHGSAAVLVDCHLMDIKRIAVALDGQINLLDCAFQALGRDAIAKLSGVGIFSSR